MIAQSGEAEQRIFVQYDWDQNRRIASLEAVLARLRKVLYALAMVLENKKVQYTAFAFTYTATIAAITLILMLNSIVITNVAESASEIEQPTVIHIGFAEKPTHISLPETPISEYSNPLPAPMNMQLTQESTTITEESDVVILAKLMWGEARGIQSESEKAAVAWCALNRVDASEESETLLEIVTSSDQFTGFSHDNPVTGNLSYLAQDVYDRWEHEKQTGTAQGRVLPKEYTHFLGDGKKNEFYIDLEQRSPWNWKLEDPYPAMREEKMRMYQPTNEEIEMIAKVLYGTARNVKSKMERAAVVWCILNRVASPLYPDTIEEVITQPGQFPAYYEGNEVRKELLELAKDVTNRWRREMQGESSVGRVLPKDYLYFRGKNRRNWFRNEPKSKSNWRWKLADPYAKVMQDGSQQEETNKLETEQTLAGKTVEN